MLDPNRKVDISDAVGRTLTSVTPAMLGKGMLLMFDDGTFAVVGIATGYEPGDESLVDSDFDLDSFVARDLVLCGAATQEEIDAVHEERRVRAIAERKERDERDFARLCKVLGKKVGGTT